VEFGRPTGVRLLAAAAPRTVPIIAELTLRQHRAVHQRITQVDAEPEPVAPFTGRIQSEIDAVTVEPPFIAARQTLDQGIHGLAHVCADVQTALVIGGYRLPHRLVEIAVDANRISSREALKDDDFPRRQFYCDIRPSGRSGQKQPEHHDSPLHDDVLLSPARSGKRLTELLLIGRGVIPGRHALAKL